MDLTKLLSLPSSTTILSLTFHPSLPLIAIGTSDKQIIFRSINQPFHSSPSISLSSPPVQISFAPAEYGSILAVSNDNSSLSIYEEHWDKKKMDLKNSKKWVLISEIVLPEEKIQSFQFSPFFQNYNLAISSSFGSLFIYQNFNNLTFHPWSLNFYELCTSHKKGVKTLSWCPNPFCNGLIAVGFEDDLINNISTITSSKIILFLKQGSSWKLLDELPNTQFQCYVDNIAFANNLGKTYESLAACGKDGVFLWNFWIEDGKVIMRDKVCEISISKKAYSRVCLNGNGNIILNVENEKKIFLLKEQRGVWNAVYVLKGKDRSGLEEEKE